MKEQIITCTIDDYTEKGTASATLATSPRKKTLEVPGAIKGEQISAKILKQKRRSFIGALIDIISPSEDRVPHKCPHFNQCGGCVAQHISYARQTENKQEIIKEFFPLAQVPAVVESPQWHYRNKMEFSFSQDKEGNRFLGLMRAGSKGRVENISDCYIAPLWMSKLLVATRKWWNESGLEAFRLTTLSGTLMNLTLRESQEGAEKMILLTVSGSPIYGLSKDHIRSFRHTIEQVLPSSDNPTVSVFILVKQVQKGSPTQIFEMHLSGPTTIIEKLTVHGKTYSFHISPQAFFQPNPAQACQIYEKTLAMAGLTSEDTLFDLYAGVGSIGICLAPYVKKVIGIESNRYSGMDAMDNLRDNQIENYEYIIGSVEEKFASLARETSGPKVVIVDPPRAGLGPQMIQTLLDLQLEKIVYISCNPKSQKKDFECLNSCYEISSIQPIDQFPHTPHLENILVLKRRENFT